MLSTKEPRPVRSLRSSLRATLRPIQLRVSVAAISRPHGLDGLDNVLIAGAAAEVALEPLADLRLGRRGVLVEQADDRHDHPGGAEAALQRVLLVERLLDGMQLAVLRQALDRGDLRAVGLDSEHGARLDGLSVDHDRARSARGRVAADVRPGEAQAVAEDVD